MSIIIHPRYPSNPLCKILGGFPSNSSTIQEDHMTWIENTVVPALQRDPAHWVYIRGFASRLGNSERNMRLSNRRVYAVYTYIMRYPHVDLSHITGVDSRGEEWSEGDERDDSPRWRSVEVLVTENQQPVRRRLPPPPPEEFLEPEWISKGISPHKQE